MLWFNKSRTTVARQLLPAGRIFPAENPECGKRVDAGVVHSQAFKTGETAGDILSLLQATIEITLSSAGEAVAVLGAPETGGASLILIPAGAAAQAHGTLVGVSSASHILHDVSMMSDNAHGNPSSSGSEGNIGSNAKKMDEKQLAEYFGNENWHQTSAKNKLLKRFAKQLKGATNADLYIDKVTGEVLLKGNKNNVWVKTGDHL